MRCRARTTVAALALAAISASARAEVPAVYPAAILPFAERGASVKDFGPKVAQILFATLAANPDVTLVDREELEKTLQEQGLNVSGAVKAGEATRIGQLTGARLLITGSVVQVDKGLYLVAKVIGTETSKVAGASVKGKAGDDLGPLAEQLAAKVAEAIKAQGESLVGRPAEPADRLATLNRALGKARRPSVMIAVGERHVGQPTIDPAAETELTLMAKGAGFEVIDREEGTEGKADVLLKGEGFSEFAGRAGPLVSVRARVEVKAIDRRSGRVLAADRQTVRVVDLSEQVAGKAALQQAAEEIAARLLPKLIAGKD